MSTLPSVKPGALLRGVRGVSLVEMMVGIVVGLIIAMAITSSVAAIGKQFRVTGAGASAAESAQLSLAMMERDVRMAGAALYSMSFSAMCPSFNMYRNGVSQNGGQLDKLFPVVRIIDGGSKGSDIVDVMVDEPPPLRNNFGVSVTKEMPGQSILKVVDPRSLLSVGDLVFVASINRDVPCTRIQVTGITGNCGDSGVGCQIQFSSITVGGSTDLYNPGPNTYTQEPKYPIGSTVFRMPKTKFAYRRYRVACNSLLRFDFEIDPDTVPADPGANLDCGTSLYRNNALAAGVVMLKAQYGVAAANSDAIPDDQWKSGAQLTDDLIKRVKAVRIAVVAQSGEVDVAQVTAQAPTVFGGALTLDLSGLALPSAKTWRNYRYRVHETVVPVRNSTWNR